MKKLIIQELNNYIYTLIDEKEKISQLNIEFYSKYKPQIGDVIFMDDGILKEVNLFTFDEIFVTSNSNIKDIIKVIHNDKEYFFQRKYG